MGAEPFRLVSAGDAMIVVEFEQRIDPGVNARAVALAEALREVRHTGVRDIVPGYCSVAVAFDPLATRVDDLRGRVLDLAAAALEVSEQAARRVIDVAVRYGGDDGPDLEAVAMFAALSADEVIALHAAPTYRVYMLGFAPGFAYMGEVDARIAMPRHPSPRVRVRRGSVGIAGPQTGIYSIDTPGGWQIVGRTDVQLYDPTRDEPFLLKAGDAVRFCPVPR
jgi:inhibitor of KinA